MSRTEDATLSLRPVGPPRAGATQRPALVLLWSQDEPQRAGELLLLPPGLQVLGRGADSLGLRRQRPGSTTETGPLQSPHLSRRHLELQVADGAVSARNLGRAALTLDGFPTADRSFRPGQVLGIAGVACFLLTLRPEAMPPTRELLPAFPFGHADPYGIVGESPASWRIRDELAFVGAREQHCLILGPSGTGKELAAGAVHAASRRASRPLVGRNAATIPTTLADAELFGSARNYPNSGMPERKGLVGEAEGSTLFLDEIAEVPWEVQAHLLRLLDAGEYHRLGEANPRRADIRMVGATNRPEEALKPDLLARFKLRVHLPPLSERREDVPLLAAYILHQLLREDPRLRSRVGAGQPFSWSFIHRLLLRLGGGEVREIGRLVWAALQQSSGGPLDLELPEPPPPQALTPEHIQSVLDTNGGKLEPTWRILGLANRHALARLVRKLGLKRGKEEEDEGEGD